MKDFFDEWKVVIGFISAFLIISIVGCVVIWLTFGLGLIENKPEAVPWLGMWVTFVALLLALVGGSITFHQIQPRPQVRVVIQRIVQISRGGVPDRAVIDLMLYNPGNAIALTYAILFFFPHPVMPVRLYGDDPPGSQKPYFLVEQKGSPMLWEMGSPYKLRYSSLEQAPIFPGQSRLLSGLTYQFDSENGSDREEFEISYQVSGASIKGPKTGTIPIVIDKE